MSSRCRQSRGLFSGFGLVAGLALSVILLAAGPAMAADCPDADNDGFAVCSASCTLPAGKQCGDCNDSNASVHPGATEKCNGVDDNCDGTVDNLVDPHIQQSGVDIHFGFCTYNTSGLCLTAGFMLCQTPPDPAHTVVDATFGTMTCNLRPGTDVIISTPESPANNNCNDGIDNDCNSVLDPVTHAVITDRTDIHDPGCQTAEICDGLDNDGDNVIDNGFDVGASCSAGVGECLRTGVKICKADHTGTICSAVPGTPKTESASFGNSCGNGKDDDCNGQADAADPKCAGFGAVELCNGVDDNGNGQIDEGFPLGVECSVGKGACTAVGHTVCKADGTGVQCSATAGAPQTESVASGNCHDFIDNDCDGLTDAQDPQCAAAFSDLGVTCSLPFQSGKNGMDCQGKNIITFSGGSATSVKADLLGLNADGSLIDMIEDVQNGDIAQLGSRNKTEVDTKRNRFKLFVPIPMLRVTGSRDGVEDTAYCTILPYLEVTKPNGETISLSEGKDMDVRAMIPLVNVDTINIKLDGIDVLQKLGINPVTAFPTIGTALCTTPGSCVFKIPAGCGDGSLVNVEIKNLRVEGLDTTITPDARNGIDTPNQVNQLSFTASGLPAGGHIFYITGKPLPLPKVLASPCNIDDLADTGTMSAFGVNVTNPTPLEVVATAPVHVEGVACGGNQIDSLKINGKSVDVSLPAHQTCTTGNGTTTTSECSVHFNEALPEKNLADAVVGSAVNASYKRGSNRVIADASDIQGNRTFNTDVVFGLGPVAPQTAVANTLLERLPRESGLQKIVNDIQAQMAAEINPAFVVGLEETAVQKFFNEKCQAAIDDFTHKAQDALSGKTFATFDIQPDCSCDLNDVPVVLESLSFTPFPESLPSNPTCAVDFKTGVIDVTIHLPDTHIQVGAHRSCTDHGIFGECIARTKVDLTAVTNIVNVSFAFTITETQIETQTPPNKDSFFFTWDVRDSANRSAIATVGHCSNDASKPCYGNKKDTGVSAQCDNNVCDGFVKNDAFDPITHKDVGIECWGADLCTFFEAVAAVLIDIFTFGLVDGFDLIGFLDFDFDVDPSFLDALDATRPDPLQLNDVKVDKGKVESAGFAQFTPGQIDVTIVDGGLTMAIPASFDTKPEAIDPTIPETNGPPATPADAPTVAQLVGVSDDISMLIADDVFNQIFTAMKRAGKLKAICSPADALTVGNLLPTDCESILPDKNNPGQTIDNPVTAALRGICHAIRGDDCLTLTGSSNVLTNTKVGTCVGFKDTTPNHDACQPLPAAQQFICNHTPARNIQAGNGISVCARQDMEPDLLIHTDNTADHTVDTDLILEDLNVVFILDRDLNGYTGKLEDLPGCFSQEGNAAPDCRIYAACADLTLQTRMGIDSTKCTTQQAGFVFALLGVIPSSLDLGAMCNAAQPADDSSILEQAIESKITEAVAQHSQDFMPPICVDGLDLGGVLNFSSPDAKLFGLTTNGGTGFADFLGITVGLGTP